MTQQELNRLQAKALEQFINGKPLFGEGGAFALMLIGFFRSGPRGRDGRTS